MKNIVKSRTFWTNLVGLIILALEAINEPSWLVYTAEGLAVANVTLRFLTNEGVGLGLEP